MTRPRPRRPGLLGALLSFSALAAASSAHASLRPPPDEVEAPRFELPDPDARLPLRSTHHEVEVVGPVAHVEITQVYENAGSKLLDATYVFPGSPRSAVASLVMRIGERTVRADLKEREEARRVFEKAKQEGFRASLLEQDRPNVFRMGLTNLRPGERVEVTLGYTELLVPEEGAYALTLPAVVAPRFGGAAEGLGERPTLGANDATPAWTADVRLADGLGITEVSSPTHDISPRVDDQGRVQVKLSTPGDAELELRWRLAVGARPDAGLVLYEGEDERFFMMTVAPPERIAPEDVPPREIAFVLDVSCSMRGYPLDVAKTVMQESLQRLRPSDRFNVLFFAGSGWALAEAPLRATRANIGRALREVSKQQGGGGTQLVDALARVAQLPRAQGLARSVVVVTDGLVSFEKQAFAKVRSQLEDTTLFTLGIGNNINRMLVEGLARVGGGTSHVAYDREGAKTEAARLVASMGAPVLTDLSLAIEGLDAYDLEPPSLPDLYADRPVVVVGKYRGEAKGSLRFSAHAANRSLVRELRVEQVRASADNAPLRALWARRRLTRVADDRNLADGGATKAEITALGLKYGLLTDHTAFVAVDSAGGRAQTTDKDAVLQPGPHPKGMAKGASNFAMQQAVGGLGTRGVGRGGGGAGYGRGVATFGAVAPKKRARRATARPAPSPDLAADAVSEAEEKPAEKSERAPAVTVKLSAPLVIEGDIDTARLKRALEMALRAVSADLAKSGAAGRLVLELKVDAKGRVRTRVLEDALGSVAARRSILRTLDEMVLAKSVAKAPSTVRVTVQLRR